MILQYGTVLHIGRSEVTLRPLSKSLPQLTLSAIEFIDLTIERPVVIDITNKK